MKETNENIDQGGRPVGYFITSRVKKSLHSHSSSVPYLSAKQVIDLINFDNITHAKRYIIELHPEDLSHEGIKTFQHPSEDHLRACNYLLEHWSKSRITEYSRLMSEISEKPTNWQALKFIIEQMQLTPTIDNQKSELLPHSEKSVNITFNLPDNGRLIDGNSKGTTTDLSIDSKS